MGIRRERVVLELEDRFTSGIARAAAATALYKKELQSLSGTNVSATRAGKDLERQTDRVGNSMHKNGSELDRFTGRAKLLANVVGSLGPSLVPIGAVGIPAVTGLASELGFLTLGIGASVLAFQGLGDAVTAMNDAALDPTEAHLEKAQETLALLSPAARQFARELYALQGPLRQLQGSAGLGVFPGFTQAAHDLQIVLPKLAPLMEHIGAATGEMAADVTGALASGRWDDFLAFLDREGPDALRDFSEAAGNTVHALSELWMAFTPLNDDFAQWLVRVTDDFDNWSRHLATSEGFQEFVDYIEENGPQVAETFGAIGNAILQVIQAASPLGGPTLRVIESLADALATIADSPLGTPLVGLISAMSALRLATQAQNAIQQKTWGAPAIAQLRGFAGALTTVTSAQQRAKLSAAELEAVERRRNETVKRGLATTGRGALTLGLLATASTGVADKFGLANSSSLALAGSLAGPWGAAVGGAIGLVGDLSNALGPSAEAIDAYQARLLTLAGPDLQAQLNAVNAGIEKQKQVIGDAFGPSFKVGGTRFTPFSFGDDWRDADEKLRALTTTQERLKAALAKEAAAQEYANSAAGKAAIKAREQIAANQALQRATAAVSAKFLEIGANADNAKVSLTDFIRGMEIQAAALVQFGENAAKAADKGLDKGLIAKLQELGPAGALRMKQLANASEAEITRANNAFRKGQIAAKQYERTVVGLPAISLRVQNAEYVRDQIKTILDELAKVKDKSVKIRLEYLATNYTSFQHRTGGADGDVATPQADGGTVPGQRYPYGDKTLILAAPGEEVITNRNGEADRYRADRAAGRIPAYADGGTVGGMRGWLNGGTDAWSKVLGAIATAFKYTIPGSLKDWENALTRSGQAIDKERAKRDDLVQKQSELVSSVAEKLRSDLFTSGSSSSVWLSDAERRKQATGDVFSTLQGDIANATAFKQALAKLKGKGLDGAAFANVAQSGDLQQVQALAALSAKDVRRFEWQFNRRQQVTQGVGSFAGSTVYGEEIKAQTAHLATLVEANHRLAVRLYALQQLAEKNPGAVGAAVGKNLKGIGTGRRGS